MGRRNGPRPVREKIGPFSDEQVIAAILKAGLGPGTVDVAHFLGYRPARSAQLGVNARLRKMERAGLVRALPSSNDRWSRNLWYITELGKHLEPKD